MPLFQRDRYLRNGARGSDHLFVIGFCFRGQCPQCPFTGRGEEPELAGGRGRHLGGELAGPVEQADVGAVHGLTVTGHDALDDRFLRDVDPVEGQAAGGRAAHQASPASSPRATGTPTSEPYSVQEPSLFLTFGWSRSSWNTNQVCDERSP